MNMEAILYPQGESKCGTTRKNTQRYFSPKRLISYLLFNCFVFYALVIRREKQSTQRSSF